jgi:hypothetical protein
MMVCVFNLLSERSLSMVMMFAATCQMRNGTLLLLLLLLLLMVGTACCCVLSSLHEAGRHFMQWRPIFMIMNSIAAN